MKLRTRKYITRQKAIRNMIQFTDLKSFLMAGFQASRSVVVRVARKVFIGQVSAS